MNEAKKNTYTNTNTNTNKNTNTNTNTKLNIIENYINSLNNIELKALEIAKKQLESSFDIEKSIGFLEYIKNNKI